MKLPNSGFIRQNWKSLLLITLLVLVVGVIARILIWESAYYSRMPTVRRSVAIRPESLINDPTEVSEVEPTGADIANHVVAADRPRYMSIPKLSVTNARVIPVGQTPSGQLGAPTNIFDVGWYINSASPGLTGTALLDGHNGGPTKLGVFGRLETLISGDEIIIERGDGAIFTYIVVENQIMSLDQADRHMSKMLQSPESGRASISIITCAGNWNNLTQTMDSRVMTRAVLKQ